MAVRKILKYPHPILKTKCKPVESLGPELKKIVTDLLETMYSAPGVGLAANQIGIPLSVCVIDTRPEGKRHPIILINPKIVDKQGIIKADEGCLSFPGLHADVKRFEEVKVEAINEAGMPVVIKGTDLLSRVLQHEIDHLSGKVFMDYLSFFQKTRLKKEMKERIREGTWDL